ncbi:MAG: hypothetical protein NTNFB02_33050 [Nitrospira sp.]
MSSRPLYKLMSLTAFVFVALMLQGCPLKVQVVDGSCENVSGILGEGNCYKHKMGQWPSDAANYPNCTTWSPSNDSWVCNSLNAACSDVATPSGKCKLNPNPSPGPGRCDCKCM